MSTTLDLQFRSESAKDVLIEDTIAPRVLDAEFYSTNVLRLTGSLTDTRELRLPHENGPNFRGWIIGNMTNQPVRCIGATGDGTVVPAGSWRSVFSDGVDFHQLDASASGGDGGVSDHGALTGLLDNDHPQYQLAASAIPTTRQILAGAGCVGGGDLSADRTINVGAAADGSISVTADAVGVGVLATDAQHGTRGGGTLHAVATSALAGFLTPIGGGTYKVLASSDGTTQTWTTTPTVASLRAVSYLEAGTYAAVATSGVGAAAGLIAQGGGVASAGGAAFLAGGAPGSGGSGGGARLYTRGDASGATSGYLHHEVTEIQGRTCIAKFNGIPVTATEFPSGNGVEIIRRALVSPTLPPITGYAIQWVGVSPGELDALVRAGPNGLTYTNHKRVTIAGSSSGTVVLGRIREDLGQYAVSPMHYKMGQAHGRIHVVVASFGSSWTTTGANEFTYHGDFTAIRLNQASPSGPPGTWVDLTPTKAALSIALDSSLYLTLTITNGTASATEAIVSWDWMQPW